MIVASQALVGCSYFTGDDGELKMPETQLSTRGMSTATGAVIGAGLGAIIGSETGNAGEGLAIGTLAGATAGGLIGHELQNQEDRMNEQAELLARQEEVLASQKREMDDLRSTPSDLNVGSRSSPNRQMLDGNYQGSPRAKPFLLRETKVDHTQPKLPPRQPTSMTSDIGEDDLMAIDRNEAKTAALPKAATAPSLPKAKEAEAEEDNGAANEANAVLVPEGESLPGDSCAQAEAEVSRARASSSDADRLFYLRRALRLCPKNPDYHVEVGKVYAAIGRDEDAQVEFQAALELEPTNTQARAELGKIAGNVSGKSAGQVGQEIQF